MNYSELQARTLNRLNMTTTDPVGGLVDEYVNEAIHLIETLQPDGWPWMRSYINLATVAGTASYSFSTISSTQTVTKVLSAKLLRQSYYDPLTLMSVAEADENFPNTTTGIPDAFWVEGQSLFLYPTPDSAYTVRLRCVTAEPDLTGSGSTPVLPTVFHSAIVEGALTFMYETLQDSTRLGLAQQRLDQWLLRMKTYGTEYQGAPRVRVRDWL